MNLPTKNLTTPATSLFLILIVVPLGGIGIDLYSASMPELATYLNVDQSMIKLTLSVFLAGLFFGMLICGILSDSYGRKYFQVINAIIFTFSSIIIPSLHNFSAILLFRFLQGVSSGGMQSVARSMITDVYSKTEITRIALYVTSAWGMGPIIAPWIGGVLAHYYGWKSCFYFFSGYGCILLLLNGFVLKETNHNKTELHIKNIVGSCVNIIKDKDFITPVIMMCLAYSILISYGILGSYFIEINLGMSPIAYGNIGLVIGFGYLLGTLACRFLISKLSDDVLLKIVICVLVLLNIFMLFISYMLPHAIAPWIINILITCFGMGFVYPIYMAKSIRAFAHKSGVASGLTVSMVLFLSFLLSIGISQLVISNSVQFVMLYLVLVGVSFLIWIMPYLFTQLKIVFYTQPPLK